MFDKKRARFILVTTISLLLVIPGVFAFGGYLYALGNPADLVSIYQNWQAWIDFAVFFLIFASVARIGYARIYGDKGEEPGGAQGLYIGVGLFAALALVLLERRMGWSLLNFGKIVLPILILIFLALIYQFLTKSDKLAVGPALLFLVLAFILTAILFPQFLQYLPISPNLIGTILFLLVLAGLLFFLWWLIGLGSGARGGGGGGNGGQRGPGMRLGDSIGNVLDPLSRRIGNAIDPGERGPKVQNIFVSINIEPRGTRRPGETITLTAQIRRGRVSLSRAQGRFHCTWYVGGIELNNQNNTTETHEIDRNILGGRYGEQEIPVRVVVQDLDNTSLNNSADDYFVVRVDPTRLVIRQPVNTQQGQRNLRSDMGDSLRFEYRMIGANPEDFDHCGWVYLQGNVNNPSLTQIENNSTQIGEGNNFSIDIGQNALQNLQAGNHYTIVCVAQNEHGGILLQNGQPVMDFCHLEVNAGPQPPQAQFNVEVVDPNTRNVIRTISGNATEIANTGDRFFLRPTVNNGNIADYTIQWATQNLDPQDNFVENAAGGLSLIELNTPGNNKEITCTFVRNGNVEGSIIITYRVTGGQPIVPSIHILDDEVGGHLVSTIDQTNAGQTFTINEDHRYTFAANLQGLHPGNYEFTWTFIDQATPDTVANETTGTDINVNIPQAGTFDLFLVIKENNTVVGRLQTTIEASSGGYPPPPYPQPPYPYPPGPGPQPQPGQGGPQNVESYFDIINAQNNQNILHVDTSTPPGPHTINLTANPNPVTFNVGLNDPNENINDYDIELIIRNPTTNTSSTLNQPTGTINIFASGRAEISLTVTHRASGLVLPIIQNIIVEFILPAQTGPHPGPYAPAPSPAIGAPGLAPSP